MCSGLSMEQYVDTVLALAIHASEILDQETAVKWLKNINNLTLEEFNNSRQILGMDAMVLQEEQQ